jgi:hypothetical protein
LQLVLQNGYVLLRTEFRRHDPIKLNGLWNGNLMPLQLQFIHRTLCFRVRHINLMTLHSMLRFYWLLSWWLYPTLSPTGGKIWGTILSPENLVPDGFIIIFWLLLWDHYVLVSSLLPHRSATADMTTRRLPPSSVFFWSIAVPLNFISTYNQFCKSCFPLAVTTSA